MAERVRGEEPEIDYTDEHVPKAQTITQSKVGKRKIEHRMTVGDSESEIFCCRLDPEDRYAACGYGDGVIRIFNMETGKLAFQLSGQSGFHDEMPITSLRWRPQSSTMKTLNVLVSTQANGSIKHWHVSSGKCLHQRCDDEDNHLYCMDYCPDGSKFAVAGRNHRVLVYDETTKSLMMDLQASSELPGHSNRIFAVKFHPGQPQVLLSGGWDNTLVINDMRTQGPVGSMYGPHICGDAIDVHEDGNVLTGSYRNDDVLQLWDLRKNECVRQIDWDGGFLEPLD